MKSSISKLASALSFATLAALGASPALAADLSVSINGYSPFNGYPAPSGHYTQFNLATTVTIGSTATIGITFGPGFTPSHFDFFDVIAATNIFGTFSNLPMDDVSRNAYITGSVVDMGSYSFYRLRINRQYAKIWYDNTQSYFVNKCSPWFRPRALDKYGNTKTLSTSHTIALSVYAGSGTFYSDSSCTTPITTASIPAGAFQGAYYYFKPTSTGTIQIRQTDLSSTDKLDVGKAVLTVNP